MMPCREASRPTSANRASTAAASSPTIARKPSSSGSPAVPVASAPITPVFRKSTSRPVTISVARAQRPARGMSRTGLCDSSAASGSSSMPRKNHIANGSAKRIGQHAVRQELGLARVGRDVPQVRPLEGAREQRHEREDQDDADRDDRHDDREFERDRRARRVERDEGHVEDDPPHPRRHREAEQFGW